MDHSRFRFLTKGLATSSGLALLFRGGELILRAKFRSPMTMNAHAMTTHAVGLTHQFARTVRLKTVSVSLI